MNLRVVWAAAFCLFPMANSQQDFANDCVLETYYEDFIDLPVPSWTKGALATVVRDSHQRVLPYTSSSREDVWDALIDLDSIAGDSSANLEIDLIYRDTNLPALEYGTPETWNREHLWPKSRGVGTSGPDYTDVHALRPSDWNVNSARSNLFFGDCQDLCTSQPAAPEAASDTAKDGNRFLPPESVRGDVARAILYMELRYSSANTADNTERLELTDCPQPGLTTQMAYLSELLQWHLDDPPDDREVVRNRQVCSRWQGNRNPFVDFPELAIVFYGVPALRPYDCGGDQGDTPPPTPRPTPAPATATEPPIATPASPTSLSVCSQLMAGDVQVVSLSSDNPDSVALVALDNLPPGLEIIVTDNAWTGTEFRTNEGSLQLQVPDEGIAAGHVFGFGNSTLELNDQWNLVGFSSFSLSTSGDSVLIYCLVEESGNSGNVNFLGGLNFGGDWATASTSSSSLNSNESIQPDELSDLGSIAMVENPGWDNMMYMGSVAGTKEDLLQELRKESNWEGAASVRQTYDRGEFSILSAEEGGCLQLQPGAVQAISVSADNPDTIAFVALEPLPPGMRLFVTDNAWTGSILQSNEGSLVLNIPESGVAAGTVFGYGDSALLLSDTWESVGSSAFALSVSGDSLLWYCQTDINNQDIQFLGGLIFGGGDWSAPGSNPNSSFLATNESFLPQSLSMTMAAIAFVGDDSVESWDNLLYVGTTSGTKKDLLEEISSLDNWEGSSSVRKVYTGGDFSVVSSVPMPRTNSTDDPESSATNHCIPRLLFGAAGLASILQAIVLLLW